MQLCSTSVCYVNIPNWLQDAERHMDGKAIGGRQISVIFSVAIIRTTSSVESLKVCCNGFLHSFCALQVVFSKQDRKTPREMAETTGSYRSPGNAATPIMRPSLSDECVHAKFSCLAKAFSRLCTAVTELSSMFGC